MINDILHTLGKFTDDLDSYLLFERCLLQEMINEVTTFEWNTGFLTSYDKIQIY